MLTTFPEINLSGFGIFTVVLGIVRSADGVPPVGATAEARHFASN